jgi:hypothetical protein
LAGLPFRSLSEAERGKDAPTLPAAMVLDKSSERKCEKTFSFFARRKIMIPVRKNDVKKILKINTEHTILKKKKIGTVM